MKKGVLIVAAWILEYGAGVFANVVLFEHIVWQTFRYYKSWNKGTPTHAHIHGAWENYAGIVGTF
jgi:hypothetical protein